MSTRAASPETLAVRQAVQTALADLQPGAHVMVACSGGPDSLALASGAGWIGARAELVVSAVVVDHGLQVGSADVARDAAVTCTALGVPADVVRVHVNGPGGPEAAARRARYGALERAAVDRGAAAVLLGHTREDQAETVLLRLARGSGARSLAAMAPRTGLWRRPFLDLPRAVVRAAADEALAVVGRPAWSDPHNDDPAFARVRVRALLDGLGTELGPGVVLGLARSAELLREDADALEAWTERAYDELVTADAATAGTADAAELSLSADCSALAALPGAVRGRVVRQLALRAGCPADDLDAAHVRRVRDLVEAWHGQGAVSLPGGVRAERDCGRLWLRSSRPENGAAGGA